MTEDQIERAVERKTNRVDRLYMNGTLNELEYRNAMNQIDGWAELQLRYDNADCRHDDLANPSLSD